MSEDEVRHLRGWTSQEIDDALAVKQWDDAQFEEELDKAYPAAKKYDRPHYWDDPDFNNPAQPVVGVCWHEARAYCAWLSAQVLPSSARVGGVGGGGLFRLPTEAEWEAAARGKPARRGLPWRPKSGRKYAYGDTFDPRRCNTFESHIRRTTPVGIFPGGETPEGVVDLCGNIWEWTSSAYLGYPYEATSEREDPSRTDVRRVVRGGSWVSSRYCARASVRDRGGPDDRGYDSGFRVVSAPVSEL